MPLRGNTVRTPFSIFQPFSGGALQPFFSPTQPSKDLPSHRRFQPAAFSAADSVFGFAAGSSFRRAFVSPMSAAKSPLVLPSAA